MWNNPFWVILIVLAVGGFAYGIYLAFQDINEDTKDYKYLDKQRGWYPDSKSKYWR